MDKLMSLYGDARGAKARTSIRILRSLVSLLDRERIRSTVQFLMIVAGLLGVVVVGAVCGLFLPL